jgi:Protein of unknown function (DUF3106)
VAGTSSYLQVELKRIQRWTACAGIVGAVVGATFAVRAQPASPFQAAPKPASEARPQWQALSAAQREALKPLEREWATIDSERKQKWLAIAAKFPSMSAPEKTRVQARMADWAKLSPQERGVARQQFQAAKRVAPQDRPSQWEAYQALSPEQKKQLAARAVAPVAPVRPSDLRQPGSPAVRGEKPGPAQAKTNIVPNPAYAVQATPVNPMALQAQPGATTTSIDRRAAPPLHQQTGMPKIAASQGFVDKTTLLPKRGPQGAATRSAAASEPTRRE